MSLQLSSVIAQTGGGGSITTPVSVSDGGTGITSYTIGDLIYASGATTLAKLSDVATGRVLISGGVGVVPSWSTSPTVTTLTGSTSVLTPLLDAASAGALNIGTTTATSIVLQQNTSVASGKTFQTSSQLLGPGGGTTWTLNNSSGAVDLKSGGVSYWLINDSGNPNAIALGSGKSIVGIAGAGGLNFGSMTGNTTLPTGSISWSGASNKTIALTAQGASGTIAITGAAASTFDGGTVTVGGTTATAVNVGRSGQSIGFFGATAQTQQVDGYAITNNVNSGGILGKIANYTDLTVYANDANAIRNNLYQITAKLKIIDDALRLYGLLT